MPPTIVDSLQQKATSSPNSIAYSFLDESNNIAEQITYGQLLAESESWAATLRGKYQRGDRVLISFPPGLDFIKALYGCLRGGLVAVPATPPTRRGMERFLRIVESARVAAILCSEKLTHSITRAIEETSLEIPVLCVAQKAQLGSLRLPKGDEDAILQYTSGSTSQPKGVILSHDNISSNQLAIANIFGHDESSRILGWLPFYHDMGLIGIVMQPVFIGAQCFIMNPAQFLRNPLSWLTAISRYQITTSGGPNFAYDLCIQKVQPQHCQQLNLSSWKVAFNGAEPLKASTIRNFAAQFMPVGFSIDSFLPCYGLAEATLLVTGKKHSQRPVLLNIDRAAFERGQRLMPDNSDYQIVSSGSVPEDLEIQIINPDSQAVLDQGQEGEIWVSGASVARGYFENQEATNESFITRDIGNGRPWLRTGDLGVILDSQLFVTGRIKDLIIINGRNIHPQDIEACVAEADSAVLKNGVTAVSISTEAGEEVLVAAEINHHQRGRWSEIANSISRAVSSQLDIRVQQIFVLRPETLPKTTSGKIQRSRVRASLKDGDINPYGIWRRGRSTEVATPSPDKASLVKELIANAARLRPSEISPTDRLFELGIDSISLFELRENLARLCQRDLSFDSFDKNTTVSEVEGLFDAICEARNSQDVSVSCEVAVPLSLYQMRFALLDQLEEASHTNTIPGKLLLTGILDKDSLTRAIETVVMRHPPLWLTVPVGQFKQGRLLRPSSVSLQTIAGSSVLGGDFEVVENEIDKFFRKPFDLSQGPLFRFGLAQIGIDQYALAFSLHHIIADGWSIRLLCKEILQCYSAFLKSELPHLKAPGDYCAFVLSQNNRDYSSAIENTCKELLDVPDVINLPVDGPFRGSAVFETKVSEDLQESVRFTSRKLGVSPTVLWLTAYAILLGRLSNQDKLVIGSPALDREGVGDAGIVGLMLNLVPVVLKLNRQGSLSDSIRVVQRSLEQAHQYRSLPLEKILEYLKPTRVAGRTQLFQVLFNYLPDARFNGVAGSLSFQMEPVLDLGSKFDLTLYVVEAGSKSSIVLNYKSEAFSAARIEAFSEQLLGLVQTIVEESSANAWNCPLRKSYKKCRESAANHLNQVWPGPIQDAVRRHAESHPLQVAVTCPTGELTYLQLDQMGNGLAAMLRNYGVVKGDGVAVIANRNGAIPWAILGVLRAGGVFTVIDSSYPALRIKEMLAVISPKVVVAAATAINFELSVPVIELPEIGNHSSNGDYVGASAPELTFAPDDPACLTFTSGSGSTPRAVLGRHSGLTAFLPWQHQTFKFTGADIFSLLSGLSHDPLQRDIFTSWWCGGTLCVPPMDILSAPSEILRWLDDSGITVTNLTPSLARFIAAGEKKKVLTKLRLMFLVGEPLFARTVEQVRQLALNLEIVNLYGSTETQRALAHFRIASDDQVNDPIPLGFAPPGMEIAVVRADASLADIGEFGEIYIKSPFLALGYRGSGADQDFIADDRGSILYRTGDFGRYLPDASIAFAERLDRQINIRGFRVDLREIEQLALQIEEVQEARARWFSNEEELLLYVVLKSNSNSKVPLHTLLRQVLPSHMLPGRVVTLPSFPLTRNGKIDDSALPIPNTDNESTESFSSTEDRLGRLCGKLMGIDEVHQGDSFISLGGNSLRAAELQSLIRSEFNVDVSLSTILGSADMAGLAREIDNSSIACSCPAIVEDLVNRHQDFPLNDIQSAYWIGRKGVFHIGDVGSHSYYEYDCTDLELPRFESAWNQLIVRHEMLRAVVTEAGTQRILETIPYYSIDVQDLRHFPSSEKDRTLLEFRARFSHEVFEPCEWPMFRISASRISEVLTRLHISFDFIVGDAWSWKVIMPELKMLYGSQANSLPKLDLSFRDYVLASIEHRRSPAYLRALEYWRERVKSLPPLPDLPLAKQPEELRKPKFSRRNFKLSSEKWKQLKTEIRRRRFSPSVVLLTAFAEVINRWSKGPRFTLNLTIFDRRPWHPQVNDIVGDFTSVLLLALDFERSISFAERCSEVQELLWKGLEHRDVSGVQVMRELNLTTAGAAGFQTMPIVFTSKLGLSTKDSAASIEEWMGKQVYSVSQTPQVWLDSQASEDFDGALALDWDGIDELFPAGLLDKMHSALAAVVEKLSNASANFDSANIVDLPIEDLEIQSSANTTSCQIPGGLLHEPLIRCIQDKPEYLAVLDENGIRISGDELLSSAYAIADYLCLQGCAVGQPVAILMEKGWEQIAAALGCMLANCPYMPLDPAQGQERLYTIIKATKTSHILYQPWVDIPDLLADQAALCVTSTLESRKPVFRNTSEEDSAYVLFTSGSTGEPQGVVIDHRGALNTCHDINERFCVSSADVVFGISSLGFDLSVFDIFGILGKGGKVVLPRREYLRDPSHWLDVLERECVTIWNSAPALMQMLVQYCEASNRRLPKSLRLVLLSGDWIPVALPNRIRRLGSNARLVSLGGATEASIWSIVHEIGAEPYGKSIPYGRPLANQEFHVLDDQLRTRPIGVSGELYIGGIGLAKGYWNNPELTEKRFITHPLSGQRLYRTGDLGRWMANGEIEFQGRCDSQVKIQGYRIELGEIEAALQSIPNIKQAVVLVRELKIGSRSLVAFFVPYQKYLNPSEIASALKDKLPSYMIPSDFIQLDAFPITRNGKVDRNRLTALSIVSPAGQAVQSNSKTEGAIAKIYTEILGLAHVDVTSSFFSLGGTSMETLTLQRELLNQLGAEVRMPDLFTFVTPRSLAEHIDSKLVSKEPSGNVQLSAAIERARTQKVARRRIGAHRGGGASITTQQQLKKPQ